LEQMRIYREVEQSRMINQYMIRFDIVRIKTVLNVLKSTYLTVSCCKKNISPFTADPVKALHFFCHTGLTQHF